MYLRRAFAHKLESLTETVCRPRPHQIQTTPLVLLLSDFDEAASATCQKVCRAVVMLRIFLQRSKGFESSAAAGSTGTAPQMDHPHDISATPASVLCSCEMVNTV